MSPRRNAVVQVVFALLLLCAQQGAITHEIWHAATSLHAQSEQKAPDSNKNRLCDLHSALGTVLGTVTGVVAAAPPPESTHTCVAVAELPAASVSLLVPSSRGPPPLL
jgi:hypothetical protein